MKLFAFCFFVFNSCISPIDIYSNLLQDYIFLNEKEKRLIEYKDSLEMLKIKLLCVNLINIDRAKYDSPPVKFDILTSRIANKISNEACVYNFYGHWNTKGENPYYRYSLDGNLDHINENTFAKWSFFPFRNKASDYLNLIVEGHTAFMKEISHKQNCIDKTHNHVGLGCYIYNGQFRYYEVYIDRYLEFIDYKKTASVNEAVKLNIKPINPMFHLYSIIIYYEPLSQIMKPSEINNKNSYTDYTNEIYLQLWPWDLKINRSKSYIINLKFSKTGLFYIKIYLDNKQFSGGYASTNDKIQASGLVIAVK